MNSSPFDGLTHAIYYLLRVQKAVLGQMFDTEIVGCDIDKDFDEALQAIWSANVGVTEDEAMADALRAIHEFRAETSSASRT